MVERLKNHDGWEPMTDSEWNAIPQWRKDQWDRARRGEISPAQEAKLRQQGEGMRAAYIEGYIQGASHPKGASVMAKAKHLAALFWAVVEGRTLEQYAARHSVPSSVVLAVDLSRSSPQAVDSAEVAQPEPPWEQGS